MKQRILALSLGLLVGATTSLVVAGPVSASPLSGETRTYALKVTEAFAVDFGQSGSTHGDIAVRNGVIRSTSGKKLGTWSTVQIVVGKDSRGATEDRQVNVQFTFSGGAVMATGVVRAPQGGTLVDDQVFAIVGGTGKFAGVMGTMTVSPVKGPRFTATLAFM